MNEERTDTNILLLRYYGTVLYVLFTTLFLNFWQALVTFTFIYIFVVVFVNLYRR